MGNLCGKILITGAAGLIGQNLIVRLKQRGCDAIIAIDKHASNTETLRRLHPDITIIPADLARDDGWQGSLAGVDTLVIAHAQIGGADPQPFQDNNVRATERLMAAAKAAGIPHIVHLSSSVVNSAANDWYTESKKAQERIVLDARIPTVVLRPTLMFGWFDRKHLGWLARFMKRAPAFPIPGAGRFSRQPLYAGNFCDIIIACIERRLSTGAYNISGLETVDYIDMIKMVREAVGARTPIVRIPYSAFWLLLWIYGLFDRNPPFTTRQLEALVTPDIFEVIDWPRIFGVQSMPLRDAFIEAYRSAPYSDIILDF
jgi:nucleoside-diphosphate-sugar epimerase